MDFNQWSTHNSSFIESCSKLTVAEKAYAAGSIASDNYYKDVIKNPPIGLLQDVYTNTIRFVNSHLGWELSDTAQGAYNVWYNGREFVVDVETSDGGASTIRYAKFLDIIRKSGNPDYKLTQEEFNDCF